MNSFPGRFSGSRFRRVRVAGAACVACFGAATVSAQAPATSGTNPIGVTLDTARLALEVPSFEAPVIAPVRKPPPQPKAGPVIPRANVGVEENGSTVAVRLPAVAESLSEPIHADGRVRLYLTLPGASAPVLPDGTGTRGLIGLKLEEGDDAVRLAIDASHLSGYRLEPGATGSTLWLETGPVAGLTADAVDAGATAATASSAITAMPPAAGDATQEAQVAASASRVGELAWNGIRAAAGRIARVVRAAAASSAKYSVGAWNAAGSWLAATTLSTPRPELIGALIGLLVAGLVAWLSLRLRRNPPVQPGAVSPAEPATPRNAGRVKQAASPATNGSSAIWAARTLAGSGLDAASIARRTGISRDAAVLLVASTRRKVPGPAASSPSMLAATTMGPIPVEALI